MDPIPNIIDQYFFNRNPEATVILLNTAYRYQKIKLSSIHLLLKKLVPKGDWISIFSILASLSSNRTDSTLLKKQERSAFTNFFDSLKSINFETTAMGQKGKFVELEIIKAISERDPIQICEIFLNNLAESIFHAIKCKEKILQRRKIEGLAVCDKGFWYFFEAAYSCLNLDWKNAYSNAQKTLCLHNLEGSNSHIAAPTKLVSRIILRDFTI